MTRVKRGINVKKRHKKLFSRTKGYLHGRKNLVKLAKQALLRAMHNAFRDRRVKKREFRKLWIIRINAALRTQGLTYSKFIPLLKKKGIELDRKVMAELAANHPQKFNELIQRVTNK